MRTLLATLVAVAAVLCMAAPARAEGVDARAQLVAWARGDAGCFTLAITHDPVRFSERSAKTAAKEPEVPASRMVVAQRAEGQQRVVPVWGHGPLSRAPTLCSDDRDPGCQCEQPDAPPSHGNLYAMADGFTLLEGLAQLGPPDGVDVVMSWAPAGGPQPGYLRSSWRPPTA
jgi:hypothetical protein